MRRRMTMVMVALLVCAAPALASADERTEKLERGEVVVISKKKKGSTAPSVRAFGLIKAPMKKIWKIIDKCDDYEKTMLRIKEAKELSRKGNVVRCRVTVNMPFPLKNLTAVTEAVHTVVPGKKYQRKWKLIEGPYRKNNGSWTLTPYKDGRTLVIYKVHAEPKVPIPAVIQQAAQKKTLPELFAHLRKQVE